MTDSEKQRALELAREALQDDRDIGNAYMNVTPIGYSDKQQIREPALARAVVQLHADLDELRRHVAHNDEEYQVMKDVLRAEHEACKQLRDDIERCRAVCEGVEDDLACVELHRRSRLSGGQHVGTGGPLGGAPPSTLGYLERLVRDLKRAIDRGARGRDEK